MIDFDNALCIITPSFNDPEALAVTLASLRQELRTDDQFILIDSSSDRDRVQTLICEAGLICAVHLLWQPPSGVYNALNAGIAAANRPWLQIVNSGDELLPGARDAVNQAILDNPELVMHVFCQQAGDSTGADYVFKPDARSVWPHQSVVLRSMVHESLGHYDAQLRLAADQVFLAEARRVFPWAIHTFVLTRYDLHGLSSAVNASISRELWVMWRALDRGPVEALWRAWIRPWSRAAIEWLFGHTKMVRLKTVLAPSYQKVKNRS